MAWSSAPGRDAPHTCAAEGPASTSAGARAHSTAVFVV